MTKEEFLSKIKTSEGCSIWEGSKGSNGYGTVNISGITYSTHKAAFIFTKGAIPIGLDVCHSCDNRSCVNPEHLFLGNRKDNMRDAMAKGRLGISFSSKDLLVIRLKNYIGESLRSIAKEFNTNHKIIGRIIKDKRYPERSSYVS